MAVRKVIMGRKVGMTQMFNEDGTVVPVTVLEVGPCYVVQTRTNDTDGYEAVQIGYLPHNARDIRRAEEMHRLHESRRGNREAAETDKQSGKMKDRSKVRREPRGPHRLTLAQYGHFLKHGVSPLRHLKEFHVASLADFPQGTVITADAFVAGDNINVTGTSKGRGFAGVLKRYGFKGGCASHGSMFHRKPASGGGTDAARVFPGARRPGHMGAEQVTVKGLTVFRADAEKNMLVVTGAVPGPNGGIVVVTMPEQKATKSMRRKLITFTALENK
jgi:large subunit ribosomal protein L3